MANLRGTDLIGMKLGRKAIKTDTRTLRLARYLTSDLAPAPVAVDWTRRVSGFGMMLNDRLGDCTIAGCGHAIQVWTANTGKEATVADGDILAAYEKWDGYNPWNKATDQGGVELDVLNNWRQQGLAGHQLTAFTDPNVADLDEIRQAINLFGGVYIGLALPLSAQTQDVWNGESNAGDSASAAGSWGGHCVFVAAYDADGFTCITWGQLKKMSTAFWLSYADEAHALLSADWLTAKGAPNGFNLQQLQSDLADIC